MEVNVMSGKLLDDLGQLQRAVIEVVWELGEASVHQVRKRLSSKKKLAYTTILTAMQKLEKAGWLRHRTKGKSYIYLPTRTREEAGASSVHKFMERMFDGDALLMFQHLMRQSKLSDDELGELRKMIDQKRKESKK
jgi:predicted transcriptional regulator